MPDPMSSHLRVPLELEGAGQEIQSQSTALVGELDALRKRLELVNETWHGEAKKEYETLKAQWDAAALGLFGGGDVDGVLGRIGSVLNLSWNNYAEAELANVRSWRP